MTLRRLAALASLAVSLAAPATAAAEPPPNDDRESAIRLGALPERASGTTVDATVDD